LNFEDLAFAIPKKLRKVGRTISFYFLFGSCKEITQGPAGNQYANRVSPKRGIACEEGLTGPWAKVLSPWIAAIATLALNTGE